jgi:hypothetical protein
MHNSKESLHHLPDHHMWAFLSAAGLSTPLVDLSWPLSIFIHLLCVVGSVKR